MACSECSHCNDRFIADRSLALDHAIKKAKQMHEDLGIEVDNEFIVTLACYLSGIGLGGD